MVDADEDGIYCKYLKPVQDRPTLFFDYSRMGYQVWAKL
jgi:hypothetical protein